jgi:hypothetical protein
MNLKTTLLTLLVTLGLTASTTAQNFNWVKQISGSNTSVFDVGQFVKKDISGNYIIAGNYTGTIDVDPGLGVFNLTASGNQDIYIVKLNPSGNFLWGKSVGGINTDAMSDLTLDNNSNINICGFFRGTADFDPSNSNYNLSTGNIGADGFILKLDTIGSLIYAKQIGGTVAVDDHVCSISFDNQGNLYATGYFNHTCDLDPGVGQFNITSIGGADIFIIKLDVNGNFVFGKTIGNTSGTNLWDGAVGQSIKINFNEIIVSGQFYGTTNFDPNTGTFNLISNGQSDCCVLNLDLNGNFIFAKSFGGIGLDYALKITSDQTGNILVGGTFNDTVDFDPNTTIVNYTTNGLNDGYLLKLSNIGSFIWCNQIGGTNYDVVSDICIDLYNNIFITGIFSNSVDFDNTSSSYILNSNGMKDAFLAGYGSTGNLIYAQNYGSSQDDEGSHVISISNVLYVTGNFQGTVDFDASNNTNSLTSSGQDAFLLSLNNSFCSQTTYNTITIYDTIPFYDTIPVYNNIITYTTVTDTLLINTSINGLNPPNNLNTIKIFPNPTNSHITINYGNFSIMNGYQLKIQNSIGQQVFQTNISHQTDYLNLSTWGSNGVYFVHIIDLLGNTVDIRKIVLQ